MTDFTRQERELAKWLAFNYDKNTNHDPYTSECACWELLEPKELQGWLLTARDLLKSQQKETTKLDFELYRGSKRNPKRQKVVSWEEAQKLLLVGNDDDGNIGIAFADAPDDYLWIKLKSHFSDTLSGDKEASVATEDDSKRDSVPTDSSASVATQKGGEE